MYAEKNECSMKKLNYKKRMAFNYIKLARIWQAKEKIKNYKENKKYQEEKHFRVIEKAFAPIFAAYKDLMYSRQMHSRQ